MSYLDDRQAILNYCKTNVDGLESKIKTVNSSWGLNTLTTAVGVSIHFNANNLPLDSQGYWEPYDLVLNVRLKNRPNVTNFLVVLCSTNGEALRVQKEDTTAQGLTGNLSWTVEASYITTNTLLYLCLGPQFTLDEEIEFYSLLVRDADWETVPSSFYTIEEIGFSPTAEPLSTPTGLYADNITSDSARVSWNAVDNASGYKVEYRQSAGGGADLSLDRGVRLARNVSWKGGA